MLAAPECESSTLEKGIAMERKLVPWLLVVVWIGFFFMA